MFQLRSMVHDACSGLLERRATQQWFEQYDAVDQKTVSWVTASRDAQGWDNFSLDTGINPSTVKLCVDTSLDGSGI